MNKTAVKVRRYSDQGLPKRRGNEGHAVGGDTEKRQSRSRSLSVGGRPRQDPTTTNNDTKPRATSVGRPFTPTQQQQQETVDRLATPVKKSRASLGGSEMPVYDAAKFRGVDKKVYFPPVEPLCCKLNLLRTHVRDLATPAKPAALLAKLVMQDWAAVLTDGQRDAVAKDGSYKAARQIEGLCELMDLFYDPQKVTLGISPDGHHLLDEAVAEARAFAALFVFEKPDNAAVSTVSGEKEESVPDFHGATSAPAHPVSVTKADKNRDVGSVRSTAIPTTTAGKTADAAKLVVKPNAQTTGDATTASAPAAAAPARAAPTSGQKAGTAGRESRVDGRHSPGKERPRGPPVVTGASARASARPATPRKADAAQQVEKPFVEAAAHSAPSATVRAAPAAAASTHTNVTAADGADGIFVANCATKPTLSFINGARALQNPGVKNDVNVRRHVVLMHLGAHGIWRESRFVPPRIILPSAEALDAITTFVSDRVMPEPVGYSNGNTTWDYPEGKQPDLDEAITFAKMFRFEA